MRLPTLCIAVLLGLGLAVPAAAEHSKKERARYAPHSCDFTQHATRSERSTRIHAHAVALEHETARLLKKARHHAWDHDWAERRALRKLRRLHLEARDFHRAIDERRRARGAIADYHELERAWVRAARSFGDLEPDRTLRRTMRRVARTTAQVSDAMAPAVARAERREQRRDRFAWNR